MHRVEIPEEKVMHNRLRKSIAFFANADSDVIVKPIDGSNKYPPISAAEYQEMRANQTWDYKSS